MRQLIPNVVLACLLSAFIIESDGRPTSCIPARYAIKEVLEGGLTCVDGPLDDLQRRAGGRVGGGGGRTGDEDSPDISGGVRPDDGGQTGGPSEGTPTDTTGEGGMGRTGGTTGGLGSCKKRSWMKRLLFWRRCDTPEQPASTLPRLSLDDSKKRMNDVITQKKMVNEGNWVFWSGFDRTDNFDKWTGTVQGKMLPDTFTNTAQRDSVLQLYRDANQGWKFWAYESKAFAQYVKRTVYAAIPRGRHINKPYADGKGSNFWTYELPELVRRPGDIVEVRVVYIDMNSDGTPNPKPEDFENSRAI